MNNAPRDSVPEIPVAAAAAKSGNGQAIASMVLGILSFVFCGPLFSIPAVILGHIFLKKARQGGGSADARGFAMAGLVLGYVNLAIFLLVVIPFMVFTVLAGGAGHVSPFIYKP